MRDDASRSLIPSLPRDRTLAVTIGRWGGVYARGYCDCWRVCLGFVAVTYLHAEFTHVLKTWLDAGSPS